MSICPSSRDCKQDWHPSSDSWCENSVMCTKCHRHRRGQVADTQSSLKRRAGEAYVPPNTSSHLPICWWLIKHQFPTQTLNQKDKHSKLLALRSTTFSMVPTIHHASVPAGISLFNYDINGAKVREAGKWIPINHNATVLISHPTE